jgi:hypothetical protein
MFVRRHIFLHISYGHPVYLIVLDLITLIIFLIIKITRLSYQGLPQRGSQAACGSRKITLKMVEV